MAVVDWMQSGALVDCWMYWFLDNFCFYAGGATNVFVGRLEVIVILKVVVYYKTLSDIDTSLYLQRPKTEMLTVTVRFEYFLVYILWVIIASEQQ